MNLRRIHSLASVLCAVAFLLQALIGPVMVRCTDSAGNSRLELGCGGESDCASQVAHATSAPLGDALEKTPSECVDEPVASDLGANISRNDSRGELGVPAPVLALHLSFTATPLLGEPWRTIGMGASLPAPAFTHGQSIVMLI